MELPPAEVIAWCRAVVAAADAARAAPAHIVAAERPVELCEADMAQHLGVDF